MTHLLEDFKAFLNASPTPWHAVREIGNRLALQDFTPLDENEKWDLKLGKKYFVVRGGSIAAFSLPESKPTRAHILAAHTDSPALKLKPNPEIIKENMLFLGTEVYGAPTIGTWMNRDLGIAGRVVVADAEQNLEEKLVYIDDAPLLIPALSFHLDREAHEKGLNLNKQEHLMPIAALESDDALKGYLEMLLRRHLSFHTLVSFDLFLVPLEPVRYLGSRGEMLASWRIDNLVSAHASTVAIASCQNPSKEILQMSFVWDHEEIGSNSSEGAASPFFSDLLERIAHCLQIDKEELLLLKNRSLCASIDVTHAFNPNFSKKYDSNHNALLGRGIVFKYNANQRYASNAQTVAPLLRLCQELNLKTQSFVTRSDLSPGSTVGPIVATKLGIKVVDLGCAQLSMHAIREVVACQDFLDLCQLLTAFLQEEKELV